MCKEQRKCIILETKFTGTKRIYIGNIQQSDGMSLLLRETKLLKYWFEKNKYINKSQAYI